MAFDAEPRVSKSRAAIERAQERAGKNSTPVYGRYFIAKPVVTDGGEYPTRQEWFDEQAAKSGKSQPASKFGNAGPKVTQGRK